MPKYSRITSFYMSSTAVAEAFFKFMSLYMPITSCHNKTSYGFYYTIGGFLSLYIFTGSVHVAHITTPLFNLNYIRRF